MTKFIPPVFLACLLASGAVFAEPVGVVTHLSGVLSVKRADGSVKFLSIKSTLEQGDILSTEANAFARIRFKDNAEFVMRPLTQFVINAYQYDENKPQEDRSSISVLKGSLRTSSGLAGKRSRDKVELNTRFATIGIRGTVYEVNLCEASCAQELKMDEGLYVNVLSGAIYVGNAAGGTELPKGTMGYVANAGAAPLQIENKAQLWSSLPKMSGSNEGDVESAASVDGGSNASAAASDSADAMESCAVR